MKIARKPAGEADRLAALRRYKILDSLPEREFDNLAKLASYICQTPVALISLVDESRQWFKAAIGIDAKETPRDVAFCAHAILDHDVLVVPDASRDDRFADNPLVTGPTKVRFYAGAPLETADGQMIGTLCVIDHLPREMTPDQVSALQVLAAQVVAQFEARSNIRELAEARDVAQRATQTKALFLANMSHEIRTPLNGVLGNTSLLLDSDLSAEQRETAGTIRSSADALLALIDDILDFSKIEAGKLEIDPQPFDVRSLVAATVKIIALRAKETDTVVRTSIAKDVPDVIVSDFVRVRQILLNLLSNAVKFTNHGTIELTIKLADGGAAGNLQFSVRDDGIGMNPGQQTLLFKEFSQADPSATRRHGGTGLGLAICKRLAGLLGGAIWAESAVGSGSTFSFTINSLSGKGLVPINARDGRTTDGWQSFGERYPLKILIAEDNKTNQMVLQKFLGKMKYGADIVETGAAAVAAATKTAYDLIFMDIHMPILDGCHATAEIRASTLIPRQPHIIAVTASTMESERQQCITAGMNDFLKKPLEMYALSAAVGSFLNDRGDSVDLVAPSQAALRPNFNLKTVLRKFDDDFEMFAAVARVFLDDLTNYFQRFQRCIDERDGPGLAQVAHNFRGASSNFSDAHVVATVGQLEIAAMEMRFNDAMGLLRKLEVEVADLCDRLKSAVAMKGVA